RKEFENGQRAIKTLKEVIQEGIQNGEDWALKGDIHEALKQVEENSWLDEDYKKTLEDLKILEISKITNDSDPATRYDALDRYEKMLVLAKKICRENPYACRTILKNLLEYADVSAPQFKLDENNESIERKSRFENMKMEADAILRRMDGNGGGLDG
ncbi:MAG TPA: hypothetical protein DF383_09375, partial [Deltaproteobacteria bacterium]|nr:hypothetical protein [Deltaproteobacteria bacterium]